ncbi:MAG: hypothetical protein OIF32_01355, partial [Campylobacterales bacterium]|nr:hypothetical protein [Campylobacterales bacterium]
PEKAEAAKYKYVYKNGKKYKVKVRSKKSKKYKKKKRYKKPSKYKKRKVVRKPRKRSTTKRRLPKKSKTLRSKQPENTVNFMGMKGNFFLGANLESSQRSDKYTIKSSNLRDDNNATYVMKHEATGNTFITDGKTYSFDESKSVVGININGGFATTNYNQIYLNSYFSQNLIDFGFTYQYGIASFKSKNLLPYIDGRASFGYNDFSSLSGFIPNSYGFGFGFGGQYAMSKKSDFTFGVRMMSRKWAEKEDAYATEEKSGSDTSIYFGYKYYYK